MNARWLIAAAASCAVYAADNAAEDPVITAAAAALSQGQPVQAIDLMRDHAEISAFSAARLLLARCQVAVGDAELALKTLAADKLTVWPEPLRPQAYAIAAEAGIATGHPPAQIIAWLQAAIAGDGMQADRALILLAELSDLAGDSALTMRCAERVWQGFSRSPYRASAGVLLAKTCAESQPLRAREMLAAVRAMNDVSPALRLSAAELLCKIILPTRAGQCLVTAEQEMNRLGSGHHGTLPLYRALALAVLDPRQGLRALEELPAELAADEAARVATDRLRQSLANDSGQSAVRSLELAEAAAELGHWKEVTSLTEPLAREQPAALMLLAATPDFKPLSFLDAPAVLDPSAAVAVSQRLIENKNGEQAWRLMSETLARRESVTADEPPLARVIYWSWQAAVAAKRDREGGELRTRMLALAGDGLEIGLAWCAEATARETQGLDAVQAWQRAAIALPVEHPWQSAAAWRAARGLLAAGDSAQAETILSGVSASTGPDQQRCRFMLAQIFGGAGRIDEAMRVIDTLRRDADAEQQRKLDRLVASWHQSGESISR